MASPAGQRTGELLAEISNMVVGVYADHIGRGPTKVRSFIDGDVAICLMEDTLTKAERTLHEHGDRHRLLDLRMAMQGAMHESLVAGMERLTERPVRALVSGVQVDPDLCSEVFLLSRPTGTSLDDTQSDGRLLEGGRREVKG